MSRLHCLVAMKLIGTQLVVQVIKTEESSSLVIIIWTVVITFVVLVITVIIIFQYWVKV